VGLTNVVPLITTFPSMEVTYNGTSGGSTYSETSSYSTIYVSSTTIKMAVNYTASGQSVEYLLWMLKDGTAVAADVSGYNITGSSAQSIVTGAFTSFFLLQSEGQTYSSILSSGYFHSTGTSSVTLGPTKMTVTNYGATTLPETYTDCNGDTTTLQTFSLSLGTPPGTSYSLLTYLNSSGTDTSGGQTTSFDYTLRIVSLTTA
jgi:hypothetical protein